MFDNENRKTFLVVFKDRENKMFIIQTKGGKGNLYQRCWIERFNNVRGNVLMIEVNIRSYRLSSPAVVTFITNLYSPHLGESQRHLFARFHHHRAMVLWENAE